MTATTGAVDQVYRQMTWFNVQWKLDVDVANVTAAYAGMNLAGPKARAILGSSSRFAMRQSVAKASPNATLVVARDFPSSVSHVSPLVRFLCCGRAALSRWPRKNP